MALFFWQERQSCLSKKICILVLAKLSEVLSDVCEEYHDIEISLSYRFIR